MGRHERCLDGSQGGGSTEKCDGSSLHGSSEDGNDEGSTLNERRGEEIDEELLVVPGDLKGPEVLEGGKERLDSLEINTLSVQGREKARIGSLSKQIQFTHTSENVVLAV